MVLNLATQQVDYTNAFCQASLDQIIFVEFSSGFEAPNKVLMFKKYLCVWVKTNRTKFLQTLETGPRI